MAFACIVLWSARRRGMLEQSQLMTDAWSGLYDKLAANLLFMQVMAAREKQQDEDNAIKVISDAA